MSYRIWDLLRKTLRNFRCCRLALVLTLLPLIALPAAAENRGYMGIGYGEWPTLIDTIDGVDVEVDEQDTRFFYGYRINRFIGVQFDAVAAEIRSCVEDNCDTRKPLIGEVGLRPALPVARWLELYGRAGFSAVISTDGSDVETGQFSWGLGLELRPWQHLAFRGEYYTIDYQGYAFEDGAFAVSVLWNFRPSR